jgi:hypothetical protein
VTSRSTKQKNVTLSLAFLASLRRRSWCVGKRGVREKAAFQFELSAQDTIVCYFQFLVSFQDFELSGPGKEFSLIEDSAGTILHDHIFVFHFFRP